MLFRTLILSAGLGSILYSTSTYALTQERAHPKPAASTEAVKPSAPPLTLAQAIQQALSQHPELQASQLGVDAAQAGIEQAGRRPNPEVAVESEDIGRHNQTISAAWVQTLELGGKRASRMQLAESERHVAETELASQRAELVARVRGAFMRGLLSQQHAQNQLENARVMREWADSVQKRVDAGKVSPLEGERARLASLSANNTVEQAKREWSIALNQLATLIGQDQPSMISAQGIQDSQLPSWSRLKAHLATSPKAHRWTAEIQRAEADARLQRSLGVQDIQVSAGVKNDRELNSNGLMLGVSVPLPLSNRNQGGIRQAELRRQQTVLKQAAALREFETRAGTAWEQLVGLQKTVRLYDGQLVPGAEQAFAKAREGYQLGKFAFIDVLDAQRALVEVRNERIKALQQYAELEAELEALIGKPLAELAATAGE